MLRHAKEAWVNQGKDRETNTMKTEQAWNGIYTVAAVMMMICRSHLTVNTMHLCYKGKPFDVAWGGDRFFILIIIREKLIQYVSNVC
jgi:hypothetical protein